MEIFKTNLVAILFSDPTLRRKRHIEIPEEKKLQAFGVNIKLKNVFGLGIIFQLCLP